MFAAASFVYDLDMQSPVQVGVRVLTVEYRRGLRWEHDRLAAPYWRFYWNLTPGARVIVRSAPRREHTLPIEPRTPYLIAPDTDFAARCAAPIDHFYVHFTLDLPLHRVRPGVHPAGPASVVAPLVEALMRAGPAHRPTLAASLALATFGHLAPHVVSPSPADPDVRRAEEAIELALPAAFDPYDLASSLGMSERTLRRRFQEATGETPRGYAERRRVDQACILLHFSDLSIDAIADETGFCDRYHFSRVFSRHRGMGPAAFRRLVEEVPGQRR
jgi:AraC-like DNA-binding protein